MRKDTTTFVHDCGAIRACLLVEYGDFQPHEPQTWDYPGCNASMDYTKIIGVEEFSICGELVQCDFEPTPEQSKELAAKYDAELTNNDAFARLVEDACLEAHYASQQGPDDYDDDDDKIAERRQHMREWAERGAS